MGRPSLAEQRRVEICRALQSCVIRNGSYEMTSVKDIAQEAGMAAGMLHHYFESKDDILQVTAEMVLLELQNHLSDLLRIKDAAEREKMSCWAITSRTGFTSCCRPWLWPCRR